MTSRIVVAFAVLATACSSGQQSNLSISAGSSPSLSAGASTTATSLDLQNGISLERIRLVVRKIKLEADVSSSTTTVAASGPSTSDDKGGSSGSGDSGSDRSGSSGSGSSNSGSSGSVVVRNGSDDGKTEVETEHDDANEPVFGPLFVDLHAATLAGDLMQLFQGLVPSGTFHELKIAIGPISASNAAASGNADLVAMATQNASIIVDGAIDGKPFQFVTSLVAQLEIEDQIVISPDKTNNITLSVDPTTWFGGTGTARLDPSDASNRSAIEKNIKFSIRGFQDDDHHGDDDHGASSGGEDGSGHH